MKRLLVLCFLVFLFIPVMLFVSSVSYAQDVITIRFTSFFPPTHKSALITEEWGKEVEKRTNGKIKVIHFSGGTLVPAAQTFDAVVQGIADAGNHVLGYTMGKFPLSEVLDYPLGYPSGYVATKLVNEYYKKFNPKEFQDVKVLYFHAQAPGIVHAKKPINKLEDLQGVKMRTFGSNAEFMSLLGGVPVAMVMSDVYDALSKGIADGFMASYEVLEGYKLAEVIKFSTENYGSAYTATFSVILNKDKWAAIPEKEQKIIEKINLEWIEKTGKLWDEIAESGRKVSVKRGNQIIKLSAQEQARWKEKAEPLFAKYVTKTKEKNLPGEDVLKFAREFLKKNTK
jgi:TRAP-type C4-dicarboxylate transport system substrate-binding protein